MNKIYYLIGFVLIYTPFVACLLFVEDLLRYAFPEFMTGRHLVEWYIIYFTVMIVAIHLASKLDASQPPSHSNEKREELDSVNSSSSSKADDPKTRTDE